MSSTPQPDQATTNCVAPPHVHMQVLSQPRYLCAAREMVSAVARRIGFDDIACSQIALAVDEALANVMRHGYGDRPDGPIWVSLWPLGKDGAISRGGAPAGLRVVIEDEARQVDPTTIRSRDLDEIRPGGLGVHIIRHVMDDVQYEKRDPKGMRLTLEKRMG